MSPLVPGSSIGAYQIVGSLGAGGMGEVFQARDTKLGRDVAIKILAESFASDPARLKRFQQETHALAALSHPNVVQVFDAGEQRGLPYLVMELVEGETLRHRMKAGPMPWHQAAELAAAVADGLAAAHAKGIIHRDLKPENLMLTPDGHVKILDFGLAKLRKEQSNPHAPRLTPGALQLAGRLTETGLVMGTADYMSPEQVSGKVVEVPSDLFSLGVILWELASGRHPFRRGTPGETMRAILMNRPELPAGMERLPSPLGRILRVCLEKDPSQRFQTARDLAEALRFAARADLGPRPVWHPSAHPPTRHALQFLSAGVALTVLGSGVGVYAWWRSHQAPAISALRAPGPPSVLALPARVYGADDAAFLTDAVPNTLSTLLSKVEGLDTKAPPSSFQMEKWEGDLARVTEAYHADHLVVTTITKKAKHLILNVQLVDTRTWKVRWGHQYEGTQADYNTLVRDAAEAVARTLTREEGLGPVIARPTTGSEGELAFGEGRHFLYRYRALRRSQDFDQAVAAFEKAFRLDPRNSEAAVQLACLHGWRSYEAGTAQAGEAERQLEATWARRALAIDSRSGLAWSLLGAVEVQGRRENPDLAVEYAVKGVCLAPNQAQVHITMATILSGPGSVGLFIAGGRRSMELDPMDLTGPAFVALGLAWMGRAEEALAIADRALLREPGHVLLNHTVRPYALARLGRPAEVEAHIARLEMPVDRTIRFWCAVDRGKEAEARILAKSMRARWLGPKMRAIDIGNEVLFNAPYLVKAGLTDDALRLLLRSVDMGNPPCLDWLLTNPEMQHLRRDPRFARILLASRNGAAMVARQLDQARIRGDLPDYLSGPLDDLHGRIAEASRLVP
ncbi:protein kinase domain-containing protein [Geothrix fuzhouensis]|uniref:protein kinase domain-containing protein n=1 Tax=Geothrix fuzhouensis TaxID=2966451 RepID=UPI0021497ED3|nr:serine/threonine-protein kinase [Geothrix fuzhouensis]